VCEKLISDLSFYPITIVSGLAYGIDSIAHKFAIENKLRTIAIPGSGLNDNVIYPARHLNLSEQIIESGGCLISEFDNNQTAAIWTFPQRNRIMAGISDLVLIIEACEKSGTMITARLALDYNIEVACVPGSIFNESSRGTNKLLRQGAHPVCSAEDVLNILGFESGGNKSLFKKNFSSGNLNKTLQKNLENILSPQELKIFHFLKNPLSKNDLIEKSGLGISQLNIVLSTLEIEGLIHTIEDKICQK
jgi:DNA processing protein